MNRSKIILISLTLLAAQGYILASDDAEILATESKNISAAMRECDTVKLSQSIIRIQNSRLYLPTIERNQIKSFCEEEAEKTQAAFKTASQDEHKSLLERHIHLAGCKVIIESWDEWDNLQSH